MLNKFSPSVCVGEGAEYEGFIMLRMPTYDERHEMVELRPDLPSDASEEDKVRAGRTWMRKLYVIAPKYVQEVAIKRKSDGFLFNTWEQLSYDSDMNVAISEALGALVGKFSLPAPSTPS